MRKSKNNKIWVGNLPHYLRDHTNLVGAFAKYGLYGRIYDIKIRNNYAFMVSSYVLIHTSSLRPSKAPEMPKMLLSTWTAKSLTRDVYPYSTKVLLSPSIVTPKARRENVVHKRKIYATTAEGLGIGYIFKSHGNPFLGQTNVGKKVESKRFCFLSSLQRDKCYKCGLKGHLKKNCPNSSRFAFDHLMIYG